LTRSLALARVAAHHYDIILLTNSPYAAHIPPALIPRTCQIQTIAPNLSADATRQQVLYYLQTLHYQCLIIDTFPRGLGGELASFLPSLSEQISRVLIHRDLNPDYVQSKAIRPFVQQYYSQILIPGEGDRVPLADLPQVQHTAPWLIRSAAELPDPAMARSLLRLEAPSQPTVVVCAAGEPHEQHQLGELATHLAMTFPQVTVRCLAPVCPLTCPPNLWVVHYPAIDLLQVANVVVGGAGYNTVAECQALGLPLVAFAFPRLYDRQAERANRSGYWVEHPAAAISMVRRLLPATSRADARPAYLNGAVQANAIIREYTSI
jgi:predicted glycosyltransferase